MDYATRLPPAAPIPWLHISEPTGFIGGRLNFLFSSDLDDWSIGASISSGLDLSTGFFS